MSTDRLGLPYILESQAQKHVTHNEALQVLDAVVQLSVISAGASAQPGSPSPSDAYILPTGKTGAQWAGMADLSVAIYQDGTWTEVPAITGMTAYVQDLAQHFVFNGTAWVRSVALVKADSVTYSHDDVTPGTGDMRLVLNKLAAGGNASIIFQTGFSGRAEIGLSGTDEFRVRVSADGSSFVDAIVVDPATGAVSFPNTP